jgi:hypothetical protein
MRSAHNSPNKETIMKNGLWITRDPKGDRAYSVWTTEPSISDAHDEWVPETATGGRQANVVVTESFAVRLLGHELRPGQIEFRSLEPKQSLQPV